jgi:hypothetical protein
MRKKDFKRKLIGFLAGEKGSIGKMQALGLGITGIIGSGLLIPHETEGWAHIGGGQPGGGWSNATWDNVDTHNDDYEDTTGEYEGWSNNYGPNPKDGGGGGGGYDDSWDDSWHNAPPSVRIEIK